MSVDWCRGPFGWKSAAAALAFVLILCASQCHAKSRHAPADSGWFFFQGSSIVEEARSQLGNGPVYGRRNLWCARFMNWVLEQTGHRGTGSDLAKSFAAFPRTTMQVGAIAVMGRRGGGHVGIVSGVDASGNPIIISGNHGNKVRESVYPRGRVWLFVEAR